jgi:hypothetical protein
MKAKRCALGDVPYTRISGGESGTSNVYGPVWGVPTDGTEVQAEAFVLGDARVVAMSGGGEQWVVECNKFCYFISADAARLIFGRFPQPGEPTLRFAVVPLPVAAERVPPALQPGAWTEEDTKFAPGEGLSKLPGRRVPVAAEKETEVNDKPKVWLCCAGNNKLLLISGWKPRWEEDDEDNEGEYEDECRPWTWVFQAGGFMETIGPAAASLLVPAHNLKPGECCEVPARECPVVPPVAEEGARWDKPSGATHWLGRFLDRHGNESDFWLGDRAGEVAVIRCVGGECAYRRVDWKTEGSGVEDYAAAFERARQLGLVGAEGGPKPNWEPSIRESDKATIEQFLGSDGDEDDFFLGTKDGKPAIILFSIGALCDWEFLDELAEKLRSSEQHKPYHWEGYRKIYDAALSANKLPPHPRYPRPEGATDWLGWFDGPVSEQMYDGWWGGNHLHVAWESAGGSVANTSISWPEANRGDVGYYAAVRDKARELGLPERDARKAKLADLDRQIAALTEERDKLQETCEC